MKEYIDKSNELGINNSLNFIGETPEVDKYLLNSDLFMLISNYEGLPVSIIEALSVGLPIIASNVGGVNELVNDGLNGFLVTKNDHVQLTEILLKIINNNSIDLVSMGEKSRNIFKEKFEINFMTKKTEDLILEILKE
jgi:glycosyltransferase involved in cell wall biosynthesis